MPAFQKIFAHLPQSGHLITSRIATLKEVPSSGRHALHIRGIPFPYVSVQSWLPPDEQYLELSNPPADSPLRHSPNADYRQAMAKAVEAGFKLFTFWLPWRMVEPTQECWQTDRLQQILNQAAEFGLHLEIVWGGSNFCGQIYPRFAPDWLMEDNSFHLRGPDGLVLRGPDWDMGRCPLPDVSNTTLLQREQSALKRLMNHLAEHDTEHRVVFIQLLNEVDLPGLDVAAQPGFRFPPASWTKGQKEAVLNYCNELGRTIKESSHPLPTRMNLSVHSPDHDPLVGSLPFIDCHGLDIYSEDVNFVRRVCQQRDASAFPHIAENAAYDNTTALMIAAIANGGGYNVYMLEYCHVHQKPGVYDFNWQRNSITERITRFNLALAALGPLPCLVPTEALHEFNTGNPFPQSGAAASFDLGWTEINIQAAERDIVSGLLIRAREAAYWIADGPVRICTSSPARCSSGIFSLPGEWFSKNETGHQEGENIYHCTASKAWKISPPKQQ